MKKQLIEFKTSYRNGSYITGTAIIAIALAFTAVFTGCKKNLTLKRSGYSASQPGQSLAATGDEFTIVAIPDAQYYTAELDHWTKMGKQKMFTDQIQWILDNKTAENIKYVAGLGDQVDGGDDYYYAGHAWTYNKYLDSQWHNASWKGGFYRLDTAGIPYGLTVGNHEELPTQLPLDTDLTNYNKYFGHLHFNSKLYTDGAGGTPDNTHYYGGSYQSANNNNHFDLFTAGGLKFIVIHIEYDLTNSLGTGVYTWAGTQLSTYSSYKAIIVLHNMGSKQKAAWNDTIAGKTPSPFSAQAAYMYGQLKAHKNIFMFLGGHVPGEGSRQDTYQGSTIKTFISDYQFYGDKDGRLNGGDGYMRLIKISVAKDLISVRTLSPYLIVKHDSLPTNPNRLKTEMTDQYSKFTRPLFHGETETRTCDFSQDGKSDLGFFDASTGNWTVNGMVLKVYGTSGDLSVPMDYNGDGRTDYAVFRPSNGTFYISGQSSVPWGTAGDIPVPADYDGDGAADCMVFRPSNANWYLQGEATGSAKTYGASGDIPTPGDYDGDGKVDISVYRPSDFKWFTYPSTTGIVYGTTGDIPVPGDYNGDGKTDFALFRGSNGTWYIYGQSSIAAIVTAAAGDIPAPGDYFGDGRTHPAIYRPSNHTLYMYNNGIITTTVLSAPGKLVNLPYAIRQAFGL